MEEAVPLTSLISLSHSLHDNTTKSKRKGARVERYYKNIQSRAKPNNRGLWPPELYTTLVGHYFPTKQFSFALLDPLPAYRICSFLGIRLNNPADWIKSLTEKDYVDGYWINKYNSTDDCRALTPNTNINVTGNANMILEDGVEPTSFDQLQTIYAKGNTYHTQVHIDFLSTQVYKGNARTQADIQDTSSINNSFEHNQGYFPVRRSPQIFVGCTIVPNHKDGTLDKAETIADTLPDLINREGTIYKLWNFDKNPTCSLNLNIDIKEWLSHYNTISNTTAWPLDQSAYPRDQLYLHIWVCPVESLCPILEYYRSYDPTGQWQDTDLIINPICDVHFRIQVRIESYSKLFEQLPITVENAPATGY